jgi:hypothetical protein
MISAWRSLPLGLLVLCPVGWLATASCGDGSKPPVASGADTGTTAPDGATVTDGNADGSGDGSVARDATTDDGAGGDGATGACGTQVATGPVLNETVVAGLPAAAAGGQIFPGEYWLTERDFYPEATDPPDAGSARAAIVVQSSYFLGASPGASIEIVEGEAPLGATTVVTARRSGTYKIGSATELTIDGTCPAAERVNVPFTVSGDELWLFPTRDRRDVYTLQ